MNVSPTAIRGVDAELQRLRAENEQMYTALLSVGKRLSEIQDVCDARGQYQLGHLVFHLKCVVMEAHMKAAVATDKE